MRNWVLQYMRKFKAWLLYVVRKREYISYHISDAVIKPLRVTPKCMELEENVSIFKGARIEGVYQYNEKHFSPRIVFKKGVHIQQNLHLTCANYIEIGENTAIAANVTITDIHHPYTDISKPIERNDIEVSKVIIGNDCKLYNNCVILPGTTIGKHVTIGANSVVSGVIPDYCVVVGCPSRIIKKYDDRTGAWRKTDKNGIFLI